MKTYPVGGGQVVPRGIVFRRVVCLVLIFKMSRFDPDQIQLLAAMHGRLLLMVSNDTTST